MKRLLMTAMAVAVALPVAATANPGKGNGNGHGNAKKMHKQVERAVRNDRDDRVRLQPQYASSCPPGLAKKSPACVPPGQAKKMIRDDDHHHVINIGQRLDSDYYGSRYILVQDPGRYGLDPYGTFYRIDGNVYRVDRETQEVLALLGAVSAILN